MVLSKLVVGASVLFGVSALQAAPDLSNLNNCIADVHYAAAHPGKVLLFDAYTKKYDKLISDLKLATPNLPHVYQEVAAKPLIQFLQKLGETRYLQIFSGTARDEQTATLQQIIPDAVLSILSYKGKSLQGINAFEEIVSDLYDTFLSNEARVSKVTGVPIDPPTYGVIPPLVKFGNADAGPYTWPGDATKQILGMGCGIVSMPPEQLNGGLVAWSCLGHETAGHDVTHADRGLLDELAQNVYTALLYRFRSKALANYWARCIDETAADVCGYINMGPSLGAGLIAYFRALGDGKLRSIGSADDPHPIDLLRGYLASAVIKNLHFKEAKDWSLAIALETHKDKAELGLVDSDGNVLPFPVTFNTAVASTEVVAQTILRSKLKALQGHSLQELQDWTSKDQAIVDNLVTVLNTEGQLPASLRGPGFYASYVVAAATTAAFQSGANIPALFSQMQSFLAEMHTENPTWAPTTTDASVGMIEQGLKEAAEPTGKPVPHLANPKLAQGAAL